GAVENLTLFHVNDQGNLVKVSENKNNLKINSVQERKLQNSKGNIFVVIKSPKGNNIPVKLNINNLNNVKASLIARLYQIVLKDPDLMKSSIEALKLAQRELGVEGNLYD